MGKDVMKIELLAGMMLVSVIIVLYFNSGISGMAATSPIPSGITGGLNFGEYELVGSSPLHASQVSSVSGTAPQRIIEGAPEIVSLSFSPPDGRGQKSVRLTARLCLKGMKGAENVPAKLLFIDQQGREFPMSLFNDGEHYDLKAGYEDAAETIVCYGGASNGNLPTGKYTVSAEVAVSANTGITGIVLR